MIQESTSTQNPATANQQNKHFLEAEVLLLCNTTQRFFLHLPGEVFHSTVPEKLSLATASTHCHSLGAQLATVGQLFLAWQAGLDQCDPGWLADGSVRYPINVPRKNCGGDEPGVRTVYNNPNRTGFPDTAALFDAYCYRGTKPSAIMKVMQLHCGNCHGNERCIWGIVSPSDF